MVPPFLSTPCKWQNNSQRTWPNQTVRAVKEIAASCGFSSSEIMRPTFLSQLQVTPSAYRLRFPDARRLDRSNHCQRGDGAVHHCAREACGSQDAERRAAGRSCRTGAEVGRRPHSPPRRQPTEGEIYQKLGDLVADGSLSASVEHVYPLDQFKEAFKQSLKSNRSGKILFKF